MQLQSFHLLTRGLGNINSQTTGSLLPRFRFSNPPINTADHELETFLNQLTTHGAWQAGLQKYAPFC